MLASRQRFTGNEDIRAYRGALPWPVDGPIVTIHVRVDQSVTMGMRLGLASPPKEGGNIYFEFRVAEKPEDPRRWLQLKGGSS
ncbi:MAG: hypothetical protein P8127_15400 [Acidobacteriota bacterium]